MGYVIRTTATRTSTAHVTRNSLELRRRMVRGTRTIRKIGQVGYTRSGYDGIPGLNYFEKGSAQTTKVQSVSEGPHGRCTTAVAARTLAKTPWAAVDPSRRQLNMAKGLAEC